MAYDFMISLNENNVNLIGVQRTCGEVNNQKCTDIYQAASKNNPYFWEF